jgi:hypothetical protein
MYPYAIPPLLLTINSPAKKINSNMIACNEQNKEYYDSKTNNNKKRKNECQTMDSGKPSSGSTTTITTTTTTNSVSTRWDTPPSTSTAAMTGIGNVSKEESALGDKNTHSERVEIARLSMMNSNDGSSLNGNEKTTNLNRRQVLAPAAALVQCLDGIF